MKKMISLFIFTSILLLGCDQSSNMFLGVGQALDGQSPKINITSPENGVYVNKSDITITGNCSDNVGVTRIRAEAGINETASVVTEEIKFSSARESSWSVTFKENDLDRVLKLWRSGIKVTFTFTCYDAAGNTTVEHLFLYVDVELPTVIINRPEVRFTEDEKIRYENDVVSFKKDYDINKFEKVNCFVNKKFILKGYVDDDYSVKSTYINIYNATKKKQVAVTPIIFKDGTFVAGNENHCGVMGNSQSWEFEIDSMDFCQTEGWFAVEVVTKDDAGNEKKQFVDKNWIYINQATDIPKNNFTSFSPGFKLNAGNVIAGNGFDDDGMKEVWIKIVPEKEADPDTPYTQWQEYKDANHLIKKCSDFTEGVQLGNWSLNIPGKAGNYIIYAIPVDINGVAPLTPYEDIYTSYFSIASEEDPVVGVDAKFRGATIVGKTEITGYFYDNNAVTKMSVTCRFDDKSDTEKTINLYNTETSNHNIKIKEVDTQFQLSTGQIVTKYKFAWDFIPSDYIAYKTLSLTFKVDDEDGNYGEDAITIYGDSERPVFSSELTPLNNSIISDVILFSGSVSDNVDVVSVTVKADGSTWVEGDLPCTLSEKKQLSSGKYERIFNSPEITPKMFGGYVDRDFIITAKDAVGNEATYIITLKGDKTKPQIKFYDENGNEKKSGNYENTSKTINVQIKPASFKDNSFRKIESAIYSVNNGVEKELVLENYNGVYYPAQIAISELGEISGDVTLQVTVTDEIGNDGEGTIYFIVDDEAPSNLAITSPLLKNKAEIENLADDVDSINENDISFYQNGEILLKGTVSDNYKIDKTILDICDISGNSVLQITLKMDKKSKFSFSANSDAVIDASGIPGNFTIKLDTTKLPDGDYILKTTSYDAAGNSTSWGKSDTEEMYFKVLQDADKPRITFNIENNATIYPGTQLKGLLIDDDALQSVKYILLKNMEVDDEIILQRFSNPEDSEVKYLENVKQYTRQDWAFNKMNGLGKYYLYMLARDIYGTASKLYKMEITVTSADSAFIKSISLKNGTGGSSGNGYYKGNIKVVVGATAGGEKKLKHIYYRIISSTVKSSDNEIDYSSSPADNFSLTSSSQGVSGWHKYKFANEVFSRDDIEFEFDSSLFVADNTETITIEIKCEDDEAISASVKDKISVDNEIPALRVTSPRENVPVNKTFEILGSCNDRGAGAKDIYISYMASPVQSVTIDEIMNNIADTPTLNKWYKLKYDNEISWSHNYQSMLINSSDVSTNYTVAVAYNDILDNLGLTNHALKIDQDGDRPTIRCQNLSLIPNEKGETWCKVASIYGTISDDDNGTLELYISEDGGQTWDGENYYQNGSWEYKFKSDGEKEMHFKVVDNEETTFRSKDSNILCTPKISDSSGGEFGFTETEKTALKIKVDTASPSMTKVYYNKNCNAEFDGSINENAWDSSFIDKIFGGNENEIYLLFGASDANGIDVEKTTLECSTVNLDSDISIVGRDTVGNNEYFVYEVDISSVNNSYLTFKANVTDKCGLSSGMTFQVNIDNDAPSIIITNQSDNAPVYGSDSNTIKGSTGDAHKTKSVEYAFSTTKSAPTSGYEQMEDTEGNSFAGWSITFAEEVLNEKIKELYGIEEFELENYPLYFWVKATDTFGNVSDAVSVCLNVIPNGDKPTLKFSYPKGGEILGGTIRITGTANVLTSEIDGVYLRIDPAYDGTFDEDNWERQMAGLGYPITPGKGIPVDAGSKTNWSLTINKNKNMSDTIAVRAYAVSKTNKSTLSEIITFEIDQNVPLFGQSEELMLVQYDAGGTELRRKLYEANTWISGTGWCLESSVEDESGISQIEIDLLSGEVGEIVKTPKKFVTKPSDCSFTDYSLKLPLKTQNFGAINFILKATDGSDPATSNTASIAINYDNMAPTFEAKDLSSSKANRTKIENINGIYRIDGTFEEISSGRDNQSGFERIAMYFTRTVGDITYAIDPMLQKGSDGKVNRYPVNTLTADSTEMYWRKATALSTENSEINIDSIPGNVRPGGLCKINETIYRIANVDSNTISVNGTLPTLTNTPVYFAIAQVIDNMTIESGKTTFYGDSNTITPDDDDQMVEGVYRSGASYTWTVSINSENILDGDTDIHFVAFDKAGNFTKETYYASVANNTPRIAGVSFGTDDNGNDEVEDNELIKTYANSYVAGENVEGKEKDVSVNGKKGTQKVTMLNLPLEGNTSLMTIKGDTTVKAKIVGGNTKLQWQWKVGSGAWSTPAKDLASGSSFGDDIRGELVTTITTYDFVSYFDVNDITKDIDKTTLNIKIVDETENGSQEAEIAIKVKTALLDTTPPTVTINSFYWNSATNNSLYQNSRDNGHIELGADLPTDKFNANSGVYDRDPKVSGKITISGTASDNVLLKALYVTIPGFKGGKNLNAGDEFKIAERNSDDGTWAVSEAINDYGWACEILNEQFTKDGNTIDWKFHWDTEKLSTVAATDVNVQVRAEDRGTASKSDNKVVYAPKSCIQTRRMDVVPYITGVTTSLSSLKNNNPSVYNRTALGRYSVKDGENVTLTGFNLGNKTSHAINSTGSFSVTVKNSVTEESIESLNNINNNDAIGSYTGIISDNEYAHGYNRRPNGDNNNLLNDDIYFVVWQFDSDAVIPKSGKIEQPIMKINPATDDVGFAFVNGPLYFSMGGSVTGTHYSYRYWMGSYDFFTSVGFTYDALGYSYGVAAGGDINSNSADKFQLMSSRWGRADRGQSGSYGSSNSLRLESIGQKGDSAGNNNTTNYFDKQRIKSPALATTVTGNFTNLYLAYYDAMNDEIRFKAGSTDSTTEKDFGSFSDYDTDGPPYRYRNDTVSMIAGSKTGRPAGEYISLGAIKGKNDSDVVVVVWYGSDRKLHYSYNTSPMNRDGETNGEGWSTPATVFSGDMENAGEYCKVAVDNNGGIHIAAYDPVNLDLCYAYLDSYNDSSFETCVVDSNGVTGSNLTLDVAKDKDSEDGNWIPYIGYYATSCIKPKYAYKVDTSSTAPAGSVEDMFTQAWECMVVPTSSVIEMQSNQHNDINIAVWKDSSGVIKNSKNGTNSHPTNNNGYSADAYGHVYGNGTSNPIMGYAIKSGASQNTIETAQMK